MTWRNYYAPKIAEIIKENEGLSVKELRKILYKANPGQYGHMKKIWSDESLKQLGLKKRKPRYAGYVPDLPNENQTELFSPSIV
jgi:hypothetical protein